MTGTEDVPRPDDGPHEPSRGERVLRPPPRLLIGDHHRRRLRDADIHEVRDPGLARRLDRFQRRSQIDLDELPRLSRRRMRDAHHLDERVE